MQSFLVGAFAACVVFLIGHNLDPHNRRRCTELAEPIQMKEAPCKSTDGGTSVCSASFGWDYGTCQTLTEYVVERSHDGWITVNLLHPNATRAGDLKTHILNGMVDSTHKGDPLDTTAFTVGILQPLQVLSFRVTEHVKGLRFVFHKFYEPEFETREFLFSEPGSVQMLAFHYQRLVWSSADHTPTVSQ